MYITKELIILGSDLTQSGHFLCAAYTTNSSALHNPNGYRFGHQKAVLTNVLLKMGIIMLETC
jgi:hypothetical protein